MAKSKGRIVMIESPYKSGDPSTNLRYLAWCELDSLNRGEFPISSHGNCPAYLPEDEEGRRRGFEWRGKIRRLCDESAYYVDLGLSRGMKVAYEADRKLKLCTSTRELSTELLSRYLEGGYPPGSMRRIALIT